MPHLPQDAVESTQKSDEEREEAEESVASLGGGASFLGLPVHDQFHLASTSC